MKKCLLILAIISSLISLFPTLKAQEPFRQHLSWGVSAAPNISGWRHNLDTLTSAPKSISPSLGLDCGFFFDFHITPDWDLLFGSGLALERLKLKTNDITDHLTTLGIDIELLLAWTPNFQLPTINFQLSVGPYTHFMLGNLSDDPEMHPFSRTFGYARLNSEPFFLLGDFNAGLTFQATCQLPSDWQLFYKLRWGLTDLLNIDSNELYVKPFKMSLGVAFHFD